MSITSSQKQYLRRLGHNLKPIVLLGSNGLTEGVIAEIELALIKHELIKVKIPTSDKELKQKIIAAILRETGATKITLLGHTLLLYRPSDDHKINLAKA